MSPMRAIFTVWSRYFTVFRKNIFYGITTTFVEPLLYLASFGFGLGGMIGTIQVEGHPISYRAFVLAGLVGQSILFQGFFEGSYGGFVRMYYQKIFQAIAVTPVTLSEVLWGELLWGASRSLLAATMVLLLGAIVGDFHPAGALALVVFTFLAGMVFSALGLLVAAWARTIESIAYPQLLFVFPMFLFCGVYFPLSNLPSWLQTIAAFLPLTGVISIVRSATLGFPVDPLPIVVLIGWAAVLIPLARRKMMSRIVA